MKRIIISYILLVSSAYLFTPLASAVFVFSLDSYKKLKKENSRTSLFLFPVILISTLSMCAFIIGFFKSPSEDSALYSFFTIIASVFLGMLLSNKIDTK